MRMYTHCVHKRFALTAQILLWAGVVWGQTPAPPTAVVDPKVHPRQQYIYRSGEEPRSVAAIVDQQGNQADFTVNEILLTTADDALAKAFAARWKGRVISRIDLTKIAARWGAKFKYPVTYRIQID